MPNNQNPGGGFPASATMIPEDKGDKLRGGQDPGQPPKPDDKPVEAPIPSVKPTKVGPPNDLEDK